jgi:hypothetical protein
MLLKLVLAVLLPLSFALLFSGCKKSNNARSYTDKMGGTRNWHRSHFYEASGMHFPTPINESYFLPDTSFAAITLNDTTIQFLNSVFHYDRTDAVNQVYFFGTAYDYYQYNLGTGVAYYYAKDSIVYCNGDIHGTSDYWKLQDLCYTY